MKERKRKRSGQWQETKECFLFFVGWGKYGKRLRAFSSLRNLLNSISLRGAGGWGTRGFDWVEPGVEKFRVGPTVGGMKLERYWWGQVLTVISKSKSFHYNHIKQIMIMKIFLINLEEKICLKTNIFQFPIKDIIISIRRHEFECVETYYFFIYRLKRSYQ